MAVRASWILFRLLAMLYVIPACWPSNSLMKRLTSLRIELSK